MENQLQNVTLEQAKRLKKAGFDWSSIYWFDDTYRFSVHDKERPPSFVLTSAPTVALALKWARDVKGIASLVYPTASGWCYEVRHNDGTFIYCSQYEPVGDHPGSKRFTSYELAESSLLDAVLDVIEKGGKK